MRSAPAHLGHLPHLLAILWAFTRVTPWLPRVRSHAYEAWLMGRIIRRGWVRVIRDAQGPAGFIARDGARIHALYVHPRARRRGMGRDLLRDAKSGCARLELWVAAAYLPARRFYAAQGFDEVLCSQGLGNDEGLPDVLMVWSGEGRAR